MDDAARIAERETGVGVGIMVAANRTRPPLDARALARLGARDPHRAGIAIAACFEGLLLHQIARHNDKARSLMVRRAQQQRAHVDQVMEAMKGSEEAAAAD